MIEHVRRVETDWTDTAVPIWMLNRVVDDINDAIDQINFYLIPLADHPDPQAAVAAQPIGPSAAPVEAGPA